MMSSAQSADVCASSGASTLFVGVVSCIAALGGLLFGYDTAVISGAIGLLQTNFQLGPAATGWAASSALAGCVLGAGIAGQVSDAIGRRVVILLSAVMFLVSAVGTALAPGLALFVVFRIIGGLGIGAASMASPLYIAEIAPARWRGRLVTLNQLAIVSGMLLIYFVNYEIVRHGTPQWNLSSGWRWMFASGALPSAALLGLVFVVPETPRFLFLKGREDEARRVVARIEGDSWSQVELHELLVTVQNSGTTLSTPAARRIGTIGIVLACLQQVTGINVFLYYAPELFKHAGVGTDTALIQTVVLGAVNLAFALFAMAFVDRIGRKPLWVAGAVGMGCCLCAVGLSMVRASSTGSLLLFALAYMAFFACSVGPVTWVILSEIFPLRFRGRLMAMATVALWMANFVVSQTFPTLDQNPWLVRHFNHGFPFLVYAFFCFLGAWFVGTRFPETKGRTLEEIEEWWMSNDVAQE
jgi:SP family xylose:H+ symportor-like MFS transporter